MVLLLLVPMSPDVSFVTSQSKPWAHPLEVDTELAFICCPESVSDEKSSCSLYYLPSPSLSPVHRGDPKDQGVAFVLWNVKTTRVCGGLESSHQELSSEGSIHSIRFRLCHFLNSMNGLGVKRRGQFCSFFNQLSSEAYVQEAATLQNAMNYRRNMHPINDWLP
ncbi:hypothetical protein STEG23_016665, partial [Scotinomys teguina]